MQSLLASNGQSPERRPISRPRDASDSPQLEGHRSEVLGSLFLCKFMFRCRVRVPEIHTKTRKLKFGSAHGAPDAPTTLKTKTKKGGGGPCLRLAAPCVGCWRQQEPQKTARATKKVFWSHHKFRHWQHGGVVLLPPPPLPRQTDISDNHKRASMSALEREHEALLRLCRVAVGLLSDIKLDNHIENDFDSRQA